jgi:hypothetical protein
MKKFEFELPATSDTKLARTDEHDKVQKIPKVFTRKEVCLILDISLRTEQYYRDHGRISFSQNGRKIFYQESDIKDFLERNHIKANHDQ